MKYSDEEMALFAKDRDYGRMDGNGDTLYDMTVEVPVHVWVTVKAKEKHDAVSAAVDALTMALRASDDIDDFDAGKAKVVETRRA